ncbi:MAG TPA: endolytic transglycosylase MltG [Flavobacteriales bacterium]|nr:endolytic transglycosylase MltG [Flavobacteriales bacterium]
MIRKHKGKIAGALLVLLAVGGWYAWGIYSRMYKANVVVKEGNDTYLYVRTGSTQATVADMLAENGLIKDKESFLWLAKKKNYDGKNVVPGKYKIEDGWSNNDLINCLRAGRGRVTVKVTFTNVRTIEQVAGQVGKVLESDSAVLMQAFTDDKIIDKYGFNRYTFITLFIPNSYEFTWNTSPEEFIQRMADEYKKFWNAERKAKAEKLGLSQSKVSVLASIVQAEQTVHADERPTIAGLYVNRIKKGMLLQSDPTVIFGIGDFSIRRVLNKHLQYDSPYNTYMYKGLPPGPINLPEISSIDAVLNCKKHNYIYMCAKPGYAGYHNFAVDEAGHNKNARAYRAWLDKEGIK